MPEIPNESTPRRNVAMCDECREPVDVTAEGVAVYVEGWATLRSGGGFHGISLPKRHSRWLHSWCLDKRRDKSDQDSLF